MKGLFRTGQVYLRLKNIEEAKVREPMYIRVLSLVGVLNCCPSVSLCAHITLVLFLSFIGHVLCGVTKSLNGPSVKTCTPTTNSKTARPVITFPFYIRSTGSARSNYYEVRDQNRTMLRRHSSEDGAAYGR